jgi:transglutaminase-like putative cysteine protease
MVIVIIFSAFTIWFTIISQRKYREYFSTPEEQGQTPPQPATAPILSAYLYEVSCYWIRDSGADLPVYITNVGYSVRNYGNGEADNVKVVLKVDGVTYSEHTISLLKPYEEYLNSFSLTMAYDSSKTISLYASCLKSSDLTTITVNATLPRSPGSNSKLCKLFITPNETNVVSIKNQILSNKFPLTPDWIALKDWVATNIKYPPDDANGDGDPDYDYIKHSKWEYWQLPKETLQLKTGDCEDYSILLVSLLRAAGWSQNDVYVVLGRNSEGKGHAWVKIKINLLLGSVWYNLEPQVGGWNIFDVAFDTWKCSGYQAECYFNDAQYNTLSF